MWFRRASEKPENADTTVTKLALVSAEIDRQLNDVADRHSNAITRASIILAAAGATAFATVDSDNLLMSAIPSGLSFLAALISFA